ncbi:hypothetical protein SBY92_002710 [Candida maltosa Xu316]
MGLINVITTDSPYYYNHARHQETLEANKFSNDPFLHNIIKEKVIYKLSIVGAFGSNPMEFSWENDDYVYDMFNIFKHRIINDSTDEHDKKEDEESVNGNSTTDKREKSSLFTDGKVGEIDLTPLYSSTPIPKEYKKYLSMSLKQLILLTDHHKYRFPPSFVHFGKELYFQYPLPISWVPLIPNPYLEYLERRFNLTIDNEKGFSNINLSTGRVPKSISDFENSEDLIKARYYNFVTDKAIVPSSGIYYYEFEVEQTATNATNFKTIAVMNDSSISANSSLNLAAGFTKRYLSFDSPGNNQTLATLGKIDLENIKSDIFYNSGSPASTETKVFLSSRPGEFPGSVAINFEDSTFYNSIKGTDSLQRNQILNMNRRLNSRNSIDADSGKVYVDIPFKTKLIDDTETQRIHKTDTIGCGINFMDKSIFLTLNGVLARVLTESDLTSNDATIENLFGKDAKDIYPIIGFKIGELETFDCDEPTTMNIKCNFGFKSFMYNIQSYVDYFKAQQKKQIEMKLLDVDDDPVRLHSLINNYLKKNGFTETQKLFESESSDSYDHEATTEISETSLKTIFENVDNEFMLHYNL